MQSQANVLIISADSALRSQVSVAIRSAGPQTAEAASAGLGLGLFTQNRPDAVILDSSLPGGMDGFAACTNIRVLPEAENTPILVITESEDIELIGRAFESGATDFMAKQANIPVLACRILHLLRKPGYHLRAQLAARHQVNGAVNGLVRGL